MSDRTLVMIGMGLGSLLGGYIPVIFGADMLSGWSILTSGMGAILGIFLAHKIINY